MSASHEVFTSSFTADFHASLSRTDDDRAILATVWQVDISKVTKTSAVVDRQGHDYLVEYKPGRFISVDVKRTSVASARWWQNKYTPDLCLETWSNVEAGIQGPLVDDKRQLPTAYVFLFDSLPQTAVVLPAGVLSAVLVTHREDWAGRYKPEQENRTATDDGFYTSRFLPVPLPWVLAAFPRHSARQVDGLTVIMGHVF